MADLILVDHLNKADEQTIFEGLIKYAYEKANIKEEDCHIPFQFAYTDQEGCLKAGITVFCYYKCLYIDLLWVHPDYRKQNLGTALINEAEIFGKKQGCLLSTVNTMDWEAPEFYKKLGYNIEFIRNGYIDNHQMICFRKNLT